MRTKKISIAKDFSIVPSGRTKDAGSFTAEHFRENMLIPLIKEYDKIEIDLDGLEMIPPSFFEEAFGGLIRRTKEVGIDPYSIQNKLVILKSNDYSGLDDDVKRYIANALKQLG